MIRRSPNRKRWVTVDNRAVEDSRLTLRAKGLLLYLLSRPDNWRASPKQIATTTSDTIGIIRLCLQELKHFGYAHLEQVSTDQGRFGGSEWVISELALDRDPEKPNLGKDASITKTEQRIKTDPPRILRASAEKVYAAYPRKVGKPKAIAAIIKALGKTTFDHLMNATQAFAGVWAATPEDRRRFIPFPATWFNQERYNDDLKEWATDAKAPEKRTSAFEIQKRITACNDAINKLWKDNKQFKAGTSEVEVPPHIRKEIKALQSRRDELKKQLTK
jgi:hypothetical protein